MPPTCSRAPASEQEATTPSERPKVVDIFRRFGLDDDALRLLSPEQHRLLRDVLRCRTAALGGHLYACSECDYKVPMYNSCRNRHCPNCQALAQAAWIEARTERILPVGHHHVVFTLPAQLRPLARRHPREIFGMLFAAANATLSVLARDVLDAQLGVTAVLHTWTRRLLFHPHLHCVVTAGGLSSDGGRWVERTDYLFPVARMKALFRAQVLRGLQELRDSGRLTLAEDRSPEGDTSDRGGQAWAKLIRSLPDKKRWVVHIQPPFGHSTYVLRYLGRYTHRVAISDHRLVHIGEDLVRFRTHGDETITLTPLDFIARYLQHVLPAHFRKIRHFGLYAPACVPSRLPAARALLEPHEPDRPVLDATDQAVPESWAERLERLTGKDPLRCPNCHQGRLQILPLPLERHQPRAPPPAAP